MSSRFPTGCQLLELAGGAILPEGHNIKCEYFDEKECNSRNDCATIVQPCPVEPEKTPSCYALWTTDPDTGE